MKPKVLILLQTKNSFIDLIKLNLEKNNFEVNIHPINEKKVLKINFFIKAINFITFPFYKNGNLISTIRDKYNKQNDSIAAQNLKNIQNSEFDYTLVFRADEFADEFLLQLKKISKKFVGFHWDGLNRTPNVFSKIKMFDDFFTFEPNDVIKYNLKFITNFYFDVIQLPVVEKNKWDISYIGYFSPQRFDLLTKLSKKYPKLRLNFLLKTFYKEHQLRLESSSNIDELRDFYSYRELLEVHNKSSIILDIKADIHDGLSFRFYEAIQLGKKIITTNVTVKQYDFYNPNNIFVLDDLCNGVDEFITKPFVSYSDEIKFKYSFSNWFQNIIGSENCIKIEMHH